jgi:hypothetical protein
LNLKKFSNRSDATSMSIWTTMTTRLLSRCMTAITEGLWHRV